MTLSTLIDCLKLESLQYFMCFCNDWLTKKGKMETQLFFNYPEKY